jgi:transposase InsO family protein
MSRGCSGKPCGSLALRHIRTRPYTPKTNGKAERFIQTMLREWAYAIPFRSSDSRAADLARWLSWYNERRPHFWRVPPSVSLNDLIKTSYLPWAEQMGRVFDSESPQS